jgi:hypothetical protein
VADAAEFNIDIHAKTVGVDASIDQVNAFADKIRATNAVATQFDTAIAAASERLKEAAGAAKVAADAVSLAETKYNELERAANKAAKELEKATQAGKDTSALKAASESAAAAMHKQASAVDELKVKATSAAAAEKKLADSMKTLQGQQAAATSEIKKANAPVDKMKNALDGLGFGDKAEKLKKLTAGIGGMHVAALLTAAAFAVVAIGIGAAIFSAAKFAVASNPEAMQRLTAASAKLSASFTKLFSGVKLDKFVAALEDVMSLFDEGTSSASAMKVLIEALLQPIFDGAAKAGPFVKEMFKGMVYGALQVAIFILKARNAFLAMLPESVRTAVQNFTKDTFTMENAFSTGTVIMAGLAIGVGVLTVALIAMAIAELAALWPILLIVAAIALVIAAIVYWDEIIDWISGVWDDFVDGLSGLWDDMVDGAKTAATDLIAGLVNGITKGASKVVGAVKDLASNAISAFTGSDGIDAHSPSRKFHMFGEWSGEGYAGGVDASTGLVADSAEGMAQAATSSAGDATGGTSKKGGAGTSITIHNLNIGNGEVAESNWQRLKQMLLDEFEGVAITIGGGEAPST